ncbi:MAG: glycosyltransferase family 2 protein [Lachnospiraceae bacterium]
MCVLVSVIVPVYNVEKYLRQCLDSLLKQTYKNIEVVMVDDGSRDSSGKICDEYAEKYENFYVIHKENAGLGMARNTGFEHIHGEYVTFLDSDDYLENNCIENLCNTLMKYQVDMCKGGFKRVIDSGKIVSQIGYQNELFKGDHAKSELLPRMIGSSPSRHDSIEMCVCGAIYKTDLIKKYNLKFPSEREMISEDLVFNIDYMQHADGGCTIEKMGYNYRVNLKSLSTSYRSDRFEASKHFYLEMKKKLQELGYGKETMLRLDRMFFVYLRMCIGQEKNAKSKKTMMKIRSIKNICADSILNYVIKQYPMNEFEMKQRIFLNLVLHRQAALLYMLSCAKVV